MVRSDHGPCTAHIDPAGGLQLLLNLLLRMERDMSGRQGVLTVAVEFADGVVVIVIEGISGAERADVIGEPAIAESVSAQVVAELAQTYGATLLEERDSRHVRFTVRVPAGAAGT